jgi:mono/diheme cytochrome c family protein
MERGRGLKHPYGLLSVALVAVVVILIGAIGNSTTSVSGIVVDETGAPVVGAIVREKTKAPSTTTTEDGTFTLVGLVPGIEIVVTAWDEGYYPSGETVTPPAESITITLVLHPAKDNPDYAWYTSMADPDVPVGCGHCMVAFPQWVENAHGQSGINPRFFSMYNGTDVTGTIVMGNGYQDDFPGTAGNCAACHAPIAAANNPFNADMNTLTGVAAEGVACEYCHKIADVYLNPATGLPYDNAPGAMSYELNRPPNDTHMFYGPYDDVTRRVTYLELQGESQFCAACHQFSFWGTPIYESFKEWIESPYAEEGVQCQACHMKPTGVDYFVYPEKGGLIRDPDTIAAHHQPGAADVELLQNTVEMTLNLAAQDDGSVTAAIAITNTKAGHHVPTDYPGRQMILVVSAIDEVGNELAPIEGPVLPDWCGEQAGLPGVAYAKVLRDVETGEFPVVNYWKQTLIESDNRIAAFDTDRSIYRFQPAEGTISVRAVVLFRRLFQELAEAKAWEMPDILMEEAEATILLGAAG